jgi:Mor family transcriptional regulator
MKVCELLAFNQELLGKMVGAGIKYDDYKHVELYNEYTAMKARGEKVTYIVAHLSERYNLSERFIYAFIARMKKEITAQPLQQ